MLRRHCSIKQVHNPNDFQISMMWTPWDDQGLGHLTPVRREEDWLADGAPLRGSKFYQQFSAYYRAQRTATPLGGPGLIRSRP